MTPEEGLRERLMRLEMQQVDNARVVLNLQADLNELKNAAAMGRGAWGLIVRLGAVLVAVAGTFAWAWDRFGSKH